MPAPAHCRPKRLRTKRERNAAKFGPKTASGGSRRGPRWLQRPRWGSLAAGSPLGPPKPVVITQKRLCHRGLFNHQVKSLDVRRLLIPGPGGDGPPPAPQTQEGEAGGVPAPALKDLVTSLASLLGSFGVFLGRDLVSERHRSLAAALRKQRQGPLDLRVFLAHRTPARPPVQAPPRQGARPGSPGQAVNLGQWELGDSPARTPSLLRAVHTLPPPRRTPSPIFGAPRERENPFSWSSAEDEIPGGRTQAWGGPGGCPPAPPPFWGSPQPSEEEERDESWTSIAAPAFSPDPLPWGHPKARDIRGPPHAPRPPRDPKTWRTETHWDPRAPSRSAPRAPWDSPDPPRTPPPILLGAPRPRPSTPDLHQTLPAPPDLEPAAPRDPRAWSPELPSAAPHHPRRPRTPQLWNQEPPWLYWDPPDTPRPRWEPPDAPRPLWDSPDPRWDPRRPSWFPQLWSPKPRWDPPAPPRPSRDPPGAPRNVEPPPCCCCCCRRRRQLCRDTAQSEPSCRDTSCRCPRPPKRRRPEWGGPGGRARGEPGASYPSPAGWGCPCGGLCSQVRRGL